MTADAGDGLRGAPEVGDRGEVAVLILAAGHGTRMRSALPKPLHPIAGRPMIWHVLRACAAARPVRTILVVPPGLDDLPDRLGQGTDVVAAVQDPPRGTGDAVRCGLAAAGDVRWLVVLFADHPLLTPETVAAFLSGASTSGARVTLLTSVLSDPGSYGRVAFAHGNPTGVVEAKDDALDARRGPTEVNSGMMVFEVAWLRSALPRLRPSPATGELYMTDLVSLAVADGPLTHGRWPVATIRAEPEVAHGINDRLQLAEADAILRDRIRRDLLASGVSMVGPETIFVDADVAVGADTTILPFTTIGAGSRIGAGCTVGPHAHLIEATIGDNVEIRASTVVRSTVDRGADVGPYAHVRGGSWVGPGAHVGTSAELKAARLGKGTKVGHFSYVGDATIGEGVNVGAGTVFANYDGRDKHQTIVGDGAFIGSDTVLIAPVRVGAGARTGAAAVVTRDVDDGVTVVGVPARPVRRRTIEGDGGDGGDEGNVEPPPLCPPPPPSG